MKSEIKKLIEDKKIKYVFLKENDSNEIINELIEGTNVEILYIDVLDNITSDEKSSNYDYISIMLDNLEKLKKQLYYVEEKK